MLGKWRERAEEREHCRYEWGENLLKGMEGPRKAACQVIKSY